MPPLPLTDKAIKSAKPKDKAWKLSDERGLYALIKPTIRIDSFVQNIRPSKSSHDILENDNITRFELNTPRHGVQAFARLENGDFIVESGSRARKEWGSSARGYKDLMQNLIDTSILTQESDCSRFAEDYAFNSVSAAAAIVNGRPSNGRIEWKLKGTNKTYKEWEAEAVQTIEITD